MKRSISIQDVHFGYLQGQDVFAGLDLEFGAGLTLLLGANGSGKSSLLKLLAGVEKPKKGKVLVNGYDLWRDEIEAREDLAYLPERPDLSPYASIREILLLVCHLRGEPRPKVDEVLHEVGLGDLGSRSVRELSKGQRRRALLAAALIGNPQTLLLDEPLDAMDLGIRKRVLEWTNSVATRGGSVIVVTHEIEPFAMNADRAIAMKNGSVSLHESLPRAENERLELLRQLAEGRG